MSTDSYANPEFVEQATDQVREQKRERREMSALQQRIEQNLESETVALPVGGEAVEFETFGRERSEWAALLQQRVRDLDGDNYAEAFSSEVDRVYRTLGEHADPDWMDMDWWEDQVSIRRAIQYITSINAEAEINEEDLERFRGE
ncbi:hypothetical protein [Halostella sp. PRR32]|uniref:hypothetical protein n=1 Tax=Halostella sp. PRR32 TaxID=3098147 RepID=UPI002B1E3EA7|nr:hypothetical protein [Halostella sp. PRR32]